MLSPKFRFQLYILWSIFWRSILETFLPRSFWTNVNKLKKVVHVPRFRNLLRKSKNTSLKDEDSPMLLHGGQTWFLLGDKYVCDFSVTTSVLGPPASAVKAARRALTLIDHYPPQDAFDARVALSKFIDFPAKQTLLGNGASEFIDIVMRGNPGATWRPGPWPCQFMEYERSATCNGLIKVPWETKDVDYTILVNPNSPTGDYLSLKKMDSMIAESQCVWIIDESFIMCKGADWRKYSCLNLVEKYPDRVIIIMSWTKVYACPGLRIGSVSSTMNVINNIQAIQTPWSVNLPAQKFIVAAVQDKRYMKKTWSLVPRYRRRMERLLKRLGLRPNSDSPSFVPWIYVDTGSAEIAKRMHDVALAAGVPVRHCESFGQPTFLRLGVRTPLHQNILIRSWLSDSVLYKLVEKRLAGVKLN
ncbi:hypothetical protein RCL1_004416 [Eukaryota sp. TZLM3-RCL]